VRLARVVVAASACVAGALAPVASAASTAQDTRPVRPLGSRAALGNERLSDERTVTRLAGAVTRARVRHRPRAGAARVARLHYSTEDGPLETYLALESLVDRAGRTWVRIRIPGRPNGRTGWVSRDDLGPLRTVTTMLRVDRRTLRATLFRRSRVIWTSRIGVGKRATPTPAGHFWIRSRLRALGGGTAYGPWAFGTAAYSVLSDWPGGGVVGIHGTNEPQLIPGRPSHGCVRVPNDNIRRLARLMPVGTPVEIT
jgi:lipoprotein-anchoring transpeptidase ErfK/SrfK